MVEEVKTEKKKTNPLVIVGIGCLVLLVLVGVGTTFVMKFFAKKVSTGLLESAIENKTVVSMDIDSGKIPDNFPKDFPVYPGIKVTSSLSGGQNGQGSGFWLTLTTADSVAMVTEFYKSAFATNGWQEQATYTANGTTTQTVKKGNLSGSISIVREVDASETQIVIVLGGE